MSDFYEFPALVCKNCAKPMFLPPATYPGTSGLRWWPYDGATRNFVCPTCKHISEYGEPDLRQIPDEFVPADTTPAHVVKIEVPCGKDGCTAIIRINALMSFDADPRLEGIDILSQSTAHDIECGKGHILSGPFTGVGSAFDAYFDQLWERAA